MRWHVSAYHAAMPYRQLCCILCHVSVWACPAGFMSGQSLADRSYGTSAEAVAWHQACGIVAVSHKLVGLAVVTAWHVGSPIIEAGVAA